jgi:hypothetical protein
MVGTEQAVRQPMLVEHFDVVPQIGEQVIANLVGREQVQSPAADIHEGDKGPSPAAAGGDRIGDDSLWNPRLRPRRAHHRQHLVLGRRLDPGLTATVVAWTANQQPPRQPGQPVAVAVVRGEDTDHQRRPARSGCPERRRTSR